MNESEEIKSRLAIEQVVGSYVPLKKAGRIYKACCPFHHEKTPSFTVSPDRGIFKCFGCGEGGDIFDFVMKIEGLTFPETLTLLAEQAGVKLPERDSRQAAANQASAVSKQRLFTLNTYIAKVWNTILTQHPKAHMAREYLERRGLRTQTIADFQIGYAPVGSVTTASLQKAGFTAKELREAGEPGKFQDRITFPIADITGRIVGFTGRLLELPDDPKGGESRGPKYWNTPETAAFVKSRTLYALHLAKRAIQDHDLVILAEGQMDVLMLHQSGFTHAVASSGTALTPEQVRLLGRFTTSIAFAYDNDKAGIQATKRGIELVLTEDLNPFVISNPAGKDPAEALLHDRAAWEAAYQNRQPALRWLIDQAFLEYPEGTPLDKKKIVQAILPWLAKITSEVEREEWVRWFAARLQTDVHNVQAALGRLLPRSTPQATPADTSHQASRVVNRGALAAAIVLSFPAILPTVKDQLDSLKLAEPHPFLKKALPLLESSTNLEESFTQLPEAEQKELNLAIGELLLPYAEAETNELWALEEFMMLARHLRSDAKEGAKNQLAQEIQLAQQEGNTARIQELFAQLKDML